MWDVVLGPMAYNMFAAVGAVLCCMGLFFLTAARQKRAINGKQTYTRGELYLSIALLAGMIVCAGIAVISIMF